MSPGASRLLCAAIVTICMGSAASASADNTESLRCLPIEERSGLECVVPRHNNRAIAALANASYSAQASDWNDALDELQRHWKLLERYECKDLEIVARGLKGEALWQSGQRQAAVREFAEVTRLASSRLSRSEPHAGCAAELRERPVHSYVPEAVGRALLRTAENHRSVVMAQLGQPKRCENLEAWRENALKSVNGLNEEFLRVLRVDSIPLELALNAYFYA